MGLLDYFRSRSQEQRLKRKWTDTGVEVYIGARLSAPSPEALLEATDGVPPELCVTYAYLSQLASEGLCSILEDSVLVPWRSVYKLQKDTAHTGALESLELPPVRALRPVLGCEGVLSDGDFELRIQEWAENGAVAPVASRVGAVVQVGKTDFLLPETVWETVHAVEQFAARDGTHRSQHEHELAWGLIRAQADAAGALYASPYLETTLVVTPQSLRLPLAKEQTAFGKVFTVAPTFDGAPSNWLRAFDGFNSVQSHYDLTGGGRQRVRVIISEPVRQVLQVIKREMPGRRVSGSRAEKFIHNPWAFLGDAAHEVLREEEFVQDKGLAGALVAAFSVVPRTREGRIEHVELIVTEHFADGAARTESEAFVDADELDRFAGQLQQALLQERERFAWKEYDLTIDAESATQLEYAQQVCHLWRHQPDERISFDDVYELSDYSTRIEGIGVATAIYVPVMQKPSTDGEEKPGWVPEDLTPMVRVTLQGHEGQVLIPLTSAWVDEFDKQVGEAEQEGKRTVSNAALPTSLGTEQARTLIDGFRAMLGTEGKVKGPGQTKTEHKKAPRETLLVKTNFHAVDYLEERKSVLELPSDAAARLPRSLRPSIELKSHQRYGVAWFQHLVSKAPTDCRGALLADDMGLGKTLQLLILLGAYYEENPAAAPSLVLAPKTLLENWAAEVGKFFNPSFPEVLVLYGEELTERKQPLGLIDERLRDRQVTQLLRPNWVGQAKILISTYEVLTSYEFSLAKQPFAFVICDEAQRIKTPGTQVTLAVKKLKADFRIACTGTPVENSLADLWCLFDFVQPGLLGGLEEFGKTYRRPIECETEAHREALHRLQAVIAPQTLRRTKADIKSDLPKKVFVHRSVTDRSLRFSEILGHHERLEVAMSEHQNVLYKAGLKKLQDASDERDARKRTRLSFAALHLMKAVCAEPYCLPGSKFLPDKQGVERHLANSPKLAWLMERLREVREACEKAIVFTEVREVQAALFYFLKEMFGLKPFVINGDSQNRQQYIERFSSKDGFDVIILSTLAAGAGLNVTAANHVFHFTRAWNPAKENQATDRAYRIGATRDVYVYCPVTVAEGYSTFDVRLDELLKQKAGLADSTMGGSTMESLLNGSGRDVSMTELVGEGGVGVALPRRFLSMDDVDRLDGYSFELFCRLLWSKAGYQAFLTPKVKGDGGVDIVAFSGRSGELIQCKSSNRELGWDAIKEVATGAARYQARYSGTVFRRLAVTNQSFTSGAREQALMNKVDLVERQRLEELLSRYPITNIELDDELASDPTALKAA